MDESNEELIYCKQNFHLWHKSFDFSTLSILLLKQIIVIKGHEVWLKWNLSIL